MLWIATLGIAVAGTVLLIVLAARVRREAGATERVLDRFGRELHPALLRVRNDTSRTRARVPRER
ncbi:MAG TPA: hypothetical protein VN636_01160 [Acidimicrobiia bacterium]|nr:hypothetical protein [Acidimicrobiia bacterium]